MTERIYGFDGPNHFLSNFYVESDGLSGEHRFQASKGQTDEQRIWVLEATTPGEAKKRGRNVPLRPDWEDVKLKAMLYVVEWKFREDPHLAEMLVATGDAELIEANTWNDRYWGVDRDSGDGQNMLGRTLMFVRELIKEGQL